MPSHFGVRRFMAVSLCILLSGFSALAQQVPDSASTTNAGNTIASDAPLPILRVSSKLVLVDVVVTDKQGKPMTGLKAEDFTLAESGKQQGIVVFQAPRPPSGEVPQTLPAGIYSNRPEFRAGNGNLSVLLIDAINTPFKDQAYARQQMLKWVAANFQPGNRMAVYMLTGNLRMLQDFTGDPKVLQLAIEQYKPSQSLLLNSPGPADPTGAAATVPALAQALGFVGTFYDAAAGYNMERRTEITLDAFKSISRVLGGLPGRKSVIWMSAGLPFSLIPENREISEAELAATLPSNRQYSVATNGGGSIAGTVRQANTDEIKQAAAQLASAQIAVYPVDVRGLVAFGSAESRSLNPLADSTSLQGSIETMREIARQTGGRAYVNQNEVGQAIPEALADNDAAYTLGYYPENKKWDNRYRELKVKLPKGDAELRYRNGYYAYDPTQGKTKSAEKNPDKELADSLHDDPPATLVGFTTMVRQPSAGKVTVMYQVDGKTLSWNQSGDKQQFSATFFAAFFSADGKMVASGQSKAETGLAPADYDTVTQRGLVFPLDLGSVKPGKYVAHIGVRDNKTGFIGTVEAAIEVK